MPLYLWREKGWPLSDQGESLRVLIADDYAGAQRHLDFAIAELREMKPVLSLWGRFWSGRSDSNA